MKHTVTGGTSRFGARLGGMIVATLGLAWAVSASAAPAVPAASGERALIAGSVIDPASGDVRRDVRIVVRDRKIVAIEPFDPRAPVPEGALDLRGMHVLPGLMDTHSHLTEYSIPEEARSESDAWIALRAQRLAGEVLRAGFTTVRDVGEKNFILTDLRRSIDEGSTRGPTIFNAGRVIAPFGGQSGRQFPVPLADGPTWRRTYADADGVDQVIRAVRENIYYGAKVIKIVADQKPYFYTEEELRAAVTEAHRAGLKVAVHLAGFQAARNAINAGVDSIEHGFDLTSADLQAMRDKGVFLSTTDFSRPQLLFIFRGNAQMADAWAGRIRNRLQLAVKSGVKLAFGTDVIWPDGTKTRGEQMIEFVQAYREAGIDPLTTLRAMTSNAAQLIGVYPAKGTVRVGSDADLIAVRGDPLRDLDALRGPAMVMKGGEVVVLHGAPTP